MAKSKEDKITVRSSELADLFGVTAGTIRNWVQSGMPKAGYGLYDLKAVVRWYMRYKTHEETDAKKVYWQARARNEQIKTMKLEESLIEAEKVRKRDIGKALFVKKSLLNMSSRLPGRLEYKDSREIKGILEDEARETLRGFIQKDHYIEQLLSMDIEAKDIIECLTSTN